MPVAPSLHSLKRSFQDSNDVGPETGLPFGLMSGDRNLVSMSYAALPGALSSRKSPRSTSLGDNIPIIGIIIPVISLSFDNRHDYAAYVKFTLQALFYRLD
jgi:hypothetical protein